jgi:phage terminase Nu1 subunit (DNA packaging protein)
MTGIQGAPDKLFFVAPVHLKSRDEIADVFGVHKFTVTEWAKDGAPIFNVGNKLQADYHALVEWLSKNR